MRDFQLEFSPFSFVALHEGTVHKQVNEHSTARVRGRIHHSDYEKYLDLGTRDEHLPFSITAVDSEGETVTVFQGVTTCVELKRVGDVINMTVEAKSGSYLMDINERFRSFQDPAVFHSEVLDLLGQPYADYNYILKTTGSKKAAETPPPSLPSEDGVAQAPGAKSAAGVGLGSLLANRSSNVPAEGNAGQSPGMKQMAGSGGALGGLLGNRSDQGSGTAPADAPMQRSKSSPMNMDARNTALTEPVPNMMQIVEPQSEVIQDMPIGQFTVQYWETDWAFAKRLASRLNACLVPADTHPGTRFYFGIPHLTGYMLDDFLEYEVVKDYKRADEKRRLGLEDVGEADALSYVVELRDIYAIGDLIQFQGMHLYVDRIVTNLLGQELVHIYYLRHKSGLRTPRYYNNRMIGASLDAQVLAVERDEVQVQITGDENAAQTIVQWFPYATVYSSPDGTGWYAMPEPGDQVRVYMPDQEEGHAVVFNALHVASEARNNPDIKSMRNKYGKEIRFTPNTLVMTNNAGMEISIIDGEGIRMESNKNIFIKADGNIDISSGAGLSMLAGDSVVVEQSGTCLVVDDNVSLVGGKLRMQ